MPTCAVCVDGLDTNGGAPVTHGACGKNFHRECLAGWIRACRLRGAAGSCPNCRGVDLPGEDRLQINRDLEELIALLGAARAR